MRRYAETLDGKVALITGAAGGLGRASALVFAREGARVVVIDTHSAGGEETVRLIRDAGGEATFVSADVTRSEDVRAMVCAAVETYGGLDCAVNAIRADARSPAKISSEHRRRSAERNLMRVLLCMKYEVPEMLKRRGGVIVNVGHEYGVDPIVAFYIPAKVGRTKIATLDYDLQQIRLTAGMPAVDANLARVESLKSVTPIGRFAAPGNVAEATVWLCTNGASLAFDHRLADGGVAVN